MTITLRNGIPVIHYTAKIPVFGIWFRHCGDSIDSYFGPVGLSHMLEHIYVDSHDRYQSNGVTSSTAVSFFAYADEPKNNVTIEELCNFVISWFYQNGSMLDRITEHDISARIKELDNETYLKSLLHGETVSSVESIRMNDLRIYSKFDAAKGVDHIRQSLHSLMNYMMDPDRIIIVSCSPNDDRSKLTANLDATFGMLERKEPKLLHDISIRRTFRGLKSDDVMLINYRQHTVPESSYVIPLNNDSVFLSGLIDYSVMNTEHGRFSFDTLHFDVSVANGKYQYQYYVELKFSHPNTASQIKYRDQFKQLLKRVPTTLNKFPDEITNLEDYIMLPSYYGANLGQHYNAHRPDIFYNIFIVSSMDENGISIKNIPHSSVEVSSKKKRTLPTQALRLEYQCLTELRMDAASMLAKRSNYNTMYFPMSYDSIVSAVMLQSMYPQYFHVERNMLKTVLPLHYMDQFSMILRDDLTRSMYPRFIINLRTYSLLEPVFDFDVAIRMFIDNPYFTPFLSQDYIYYTPPRLSLCNDMYVGSWPFKYFIHILDYEPGTYSQIIRKTYKESGLVYHGNMNYYDKYTVIQGIME